MMGRTHALTGALAGLLAGRLVGLDTAPAVLPFAAVTAGYALVPDLDHPQATVSRLFGPVTGLLSRVLRSSSGWLYRRTKGPRDEQCAGTHRHMTHTLLFALVVGGVCAISTALGGPWAVAGWLAFGLLLAADRLGTPVLIAYGGGLAASLVTVAGNEPVGQTLLNLLNESAGWLGIAVALGCFVHCLGDAITESGCPFLFPLLIAGETWYEIRPPRWLRFPTGRTVEKRLVFPVAALGCVLAVPGVLPYLLDALAPLARTAAGGGTR